MPYINQLPVVDSLAPGDNFPLYSQGQGDARRTPLSLLLQYMQDNLVFGTPDSFSSQYAAPNLNGFSVAVDEGVGDVHLILTPTAGFAAGTIVLPIVTSVIDKQEILVNCTQQVAALTVDGNGAGAVSGAPASLGADDFFRLKYDAFTSTWYRVG